MRAVASAACAVILAVGVPGNLLVPAVILRARDMRTSTNIFLVNLSAADLLVLLVCAPATLVELHSRPEVWLLGERLCKMVPFVELTVAHTSVLTILAISFERYYAICEPLRAGYVCTRARAAALSLLAWLLAALATSPIIAISEYRHEEYVDGSLVPVCITAADSSSKGVFFLATIAVFFALPLAVLVGLYAAIARRLSALPAATLASRRALGHRKQVVLMLGTVVLLFFACLLPFRALTLWIVVGPPDATHALDADSYYSFLFFCRAMVYLNSAVNPILYNIMSSKFRAAFLRLCLGGRGRGRGRRRPGTAVGPGPAPAGSLSLARRSTLNATVTSSSLLPASAGPGAGAARARPLLVRCSLPGPDGGCGGGGCGGGGCGGGAPRRASGPARGESFV